MGSKATGIPFIKKMIGLYYSMDAEQRNRFFSYKSDYYQFFSYLTLIVGAICDIGYLASDYLLNGSLWPVIIPRSSILIALAIYIYAEKHVGNARIRTVMNYGMIHAITWSTMMTVYFLEDKTHFAEGAYTMNLLFFCVGLGTRPVSALINYIIFFGEILLTNLFIHYPNLDVILSLCLPFSIGILAGLYLLMLVTLDHYGVERELNEALVTDVLTKVGNRDKLESMILNNRLKDVTEPASIAMLDVDLFKDVNDTYGHEMGDLVLAYLGKFLKARVRADDTIIRYGGEEFVIIMNKCGGFDAYSKMDALREELSHRLERPVDFTISIGVAEYTGVFDRDLRNADNAMYQAKRNGRNMVCTVKDIEP